MSRPRCILNAVITAVMSLAFAACQGDVDNDDFEGWVDEVQGFIASQTPDEDVTHLLHTARFPCRGCYRSLPGFEDHETVLRFATPDGATLILKWTTADLNEGVATFPIEDVPAAIPRGNTWILPRAPQGKAAVYLGAEAFDEVGELEVVDAFWPQAPGDVGGAWLHLRDALFDGLPVAGTFFVSLAMRRQNERPPGFGGRDQPCADHSCDEGYVCVNEHEQMMCRLPCAGDEECGNAICEQWPGWGGICREAALAGERGGACLDDGRCSPGHVCAVSENPDRCRRLCDDEGFTPTCGGSALCVEGRCRPTVEVGMTHGPCRSNTCDLPSLVCVEGESPTCRRRCQLGQSEDPCGVRFACVEREGQDAVCVPANLASEPCPCDDHLVCVVRTGDPAGGLCRSPCTINDDGSDNCPDGFGRCVLQPGTPEDGVCLLAPP